MNQETEIILFLRAENQRLRSIIKRLLRLFHILHLIKKKRTRPIAFGDDPIDLYEQNMSQEIKRK